MPRMEKRVELLRLTLKLHSFLGAIQNVALKFLVLIFSPKMDNMLIGQ